jgi:hypothetical protein
MDGVRHQMKVTRHLGNFTVTTIAVVVFLSLIMGAIFVSLAITDADVVKGEPLLRLCAFLYGLSCFVPPILVSLFLRLHQVDRHLHDEILGRWHQTPGAFIVCVPRSELMILHRVVHRIAKTSTLPMGLRRLAAIVWFYEASAVLALGASAVFLVVQRALVQNA